jgi:hypothetical protein
MWLTGEGSAFACLQGHTEPQTPQKPPTLVCGWLGGPAVASGARPERAAGTKAGAELHVM